MFNSLRARASQHNILALCYDAADFKSPISSSHSLKFELEEGVYLRAANFLTTFVALLSCKVFTTLHLAQRSKDYVTTNYNKYMLKATLNCLPNTLP